MGGALGHSLPTASSSNLGPGPSLLAVSPHGDARGCSLLEGGFLPAW